MYFKLYCKLFAKIKLNWIKSIVNISHYWISYLPKSMQCEMYLSSGVDNQFEEVISVMKIY